MAHQRPTRLRHPVARGDGRHHSTVTPPPIVVRGQVSSRLMVYASSEPHKLVAGEEINLFHTRRDESGPGVVGDPVFRRGRPNDDFAEVGLGGLQCILRRPGGHVVDRFTTSATGHFSSAVGLALGASFELVVVFVPEQDPTIASEAPHQRDDPWWRDDHVHRPRPPQRDPAADPDVFRYFRETVVVSFTLPRHLPESAAPTRVAVHATAHLTDENVLDRQERDHPDQIGDGETRGHEGREYDRESFDGWLVGPTRDAGPALELFGDSSVLMGSYVLRVGWMSQRLGADTNQPDHVRHPSEHGGMANWRFVRAHLCICACTAMLLRYYGREASTMDVARAASRLFLDEHWARGEQPHFRLLDPSGTSLTLSDSPARDPHGPPVYETLLVTAPDGSQLLGTWPHTKERYPISAAAELLDGARTPGGLRWFTGADVAAPGGLDAAREAMRRFEDWRRWWQRRPERDVFGDQLRREDAQAGRPSQTFATRRTIVAAGYQSSSTSPVPLTHDRVLRLLSMGWPLITVAEIHTSSIKHGRVCFGAVLKHDGTVHQLYAHNPNHIEELPPGPTADIGALGYFIVAEELSTREVLAKVVSGGLAPERTVRHFIR